MLDTQLRLGGGVHAPLPQGVTLRPATLYDCVSLAPRLRQADKDEAYAASGVAAEFAIKLSLLSSPALVACVEGQPEMIFGCPHGHPWMLCTPVAVSPRWRKTFVKHSQAYIDDWQAQWGLLHNFTDARNSAHHVWLRRVGFTFIARHDRYGPFGLPFYEFVRIAPCA